MHHLTEILNHHPQAEGLGTNRIMSLAATLSECSLSCYACADACLAEKKVDKLRKCINTDLACAETTRAFGTVLTRQGPMDVAVSRALAQACEIACRSCAEECEKHADKHAHCEHCAKICRECETHCRELKQTF